MGNLKELRTRITSIKSTQQITKAMKMVSAAKLRRAQTTLQQMRPYDNKLHKMFMNLADQVSDSEYQVYFEEREVKRMLMVVVTADRGLAGSFNSAVIKEAVRLLKNDFSRLHKNNAADIYSIGKKGRDFFVKNDYKVVGEHNGIFNSFGYDDVEKIGEKLITMFLEGEYDKIVIVHNYFRNAAVFPTVSETYLPVSIEAEEKEEAQGEKTGKYNNYYIFEPDKEEILSRIIPLSLRIHLYRILLESNTAEHGARMTAMDNATNNADDLLRDLRVQYNKERQATITTEILDIINGMRALEG